MEKRGRFSNARSNIRSISRERQLIIFWCVEESRVRHSTNTGLKEGGSYLVSSVVGGEA
jgi:hypothetical protein